MKEERGMKNWLRVQQLRREVRLGGPETVIRISGTYRLARPLFLASPGPTLQGPATFKASRWMRGPLIKMPIPGPEKP